jgi:cation:H+ antiporter
LLYIIFLVIGFILLIKGADFLVDGASSVARNFNISDLVIGLTVVAFGTSTPELFVNISASLGGNSEIAVGNILGSNISNILLILGISSIIYPLSVTRGTVWKEIPFSLLAVIVLGVFANDRFIDGAPSSVLTRIDGLVLLMFFIIFIYYTAGIAIRIEGMEEHVPVRKYSITRSIIMVVIGLIGLILGGNWIVKGSVYSAAMLGMSESLIGLTIVAVGTSLPELATSAMAAYRKNTEIAIGNVVGSNIFNIFFVLGISSLIRPLTFHSKSNIDIGMVIIATLFLFFSMFTGKKHSLDRWEGVLFIVVYCGYITYLVIQG